MLALVLRQAVTLSATRTVALARKYCSTADHGRGKHWDYCQNVYRACCWLVVRQSYHTHTFGAKLRALFAAGSNSNPSNISGPKAFSSSGAPEESVRLPGIDDRSRGVAAYWLSDSRTSVPPALTFMHTTYYIVISVPSRCDDNERQPAP